MHDPLWRMSLRLWMLDNAGAPERQKAGLVKGEPQRYIDGHILRPALKLRWASSERERAARERECERDGCAARFLPTPDQLRRGGGRFCSLACYHIALRKYPVAEPRLCAREGCDVVFLPHASATGRADKGRYCSRQCADRAKLTKVGRKVAFACAHCGRLKFVRRWYPEQASGTDRDG